MAKTLNPRQQRFVQEYLIDLNATQAAIRAGYTHPTTQGPRLLENVGIRQAISAAQAKAAKRHDMTLDRITQMLIEDRELAREANQNGAAVSATMGLAKIHGHIKDRQEVTGKDGGPIEHRDHTELTQTERLQRLAGIFKPSRSGTSETSH